MTYYLKYRPQKISDLDLALVRDQLGLTLGGKSMPHAFLFVGPRGAGKTSAARILAKVVNCELKVGLTGPAGGEPCNKCEQCVSITNGSSLDVIEIDAASNRGVDDIRALREVIKLSPLSASRKVYIIDEAHMLTTEASNALLKTLEEPPSHVLFVLATTAPEKLLETIRSRCTIVSFKKASIEEVILSLKKVVDGEGLKFEDGVLEEIARLADGGFRDAHKILEQVGSGREKISLRDIKEIVGGRGDYRLFWERLADRDLKGALSEIEKMVVAGENVRLVVSETVGVLRECLLSSVSLEKAEIDFGDLDLLQGIELLSKAYVEIPSSPIPQLPLEVGVVRWIGDSEERPGSKRLSGNSVSSDKVGRNNTEGLRGIQDTNSNSSVSTSNTPDWRVSNPTHSSKRGGQARVSGAKVQPPAGLDLEECWREVMKRVRPINSSVEALLRATRVRGFESGVLNIEVFYQFHKEKMEKEPYRSILEKLTEEVLGQPARLVFVISQESKKARDITNIVEDVDEEIIRAAEEIFGGKESGGGLPN